MNDKLVSQLKELKNLKIVLTRLEDDKLLTPNPYYRPTERFYSPDLFATSSCSTQTSFNLTRSSNDNDFCATPSTTKTSFSNMASTPPSGPNRCRARSNLSESSTTTLGSSLPSLESQEPKHDLDTGNSCRFSGIAFPVALKRSDQIRRSITAKRKVCRPEMMGYKKRRRAPKITGETGNRRPTTDVPKVFSIDSDESEVDLAKPQASISEPTLHSKPATVSKPALVSKPAVDPKPAAVPKPKEAPKLPESQKASAASKTTPEPNPPKSNSGSLLVKTPSTIVSSTSTGKAPNCTVVTRNRGRSIFQERKPLEPETATAPPKNAEQKKAATPKKTDQKKAAPPKNAEQKKTAPPKVVQPKRVTQRKKSTQPAKPVAKPKVTPPAQADAPKPPEPAPQRFLPSSSSSSTSSSSSSDSSSDDDVQVITEQPDLKPSEAKPSMPSLTEPFLKLNRITVPEPTARKTPPRRVLTEAEVMDAIFRMSPPPQQLPPPGMMDPPNFTMHVIDDTNNRILYQPNTNLVGNFAHGQPRRQFRRPRRPNRRFESTGTQTVIMTEGLVRTVQQMCETQGTVSFLLYMMQILAEGGLTTDVQLDLFAKVLQAQSRNRTKRSHPKAKRAAGRNGFQRRNSARNRFGNGGSTHTTSTNSLMSEMNSSSAGQGDMELYSECGPQGSSQNMFSSTMMPTISGIQPIGNTQYIQSMNNTTMLTEQFLNTFNSSMANVVHVIPGSQIYEQNNTFQQTNTNSTVDSGLAILTNTFADNSIQDSFDVPVVNVPEEPVQAPTQKKKEKQKKRFIQKAINPFSKPKLLVNPFAKRSQNVNKSPQKPPKPIIKIHAARKDVTKNGKKKITISDYKKRLEVESKRVEKKKQSLEELLATYDVSPVTVPIPTPPKPASQGSVDSGNLLIDENVGENDLANSRTEFEILLAELNAMPVTDQENLADVHSDDEVQKDDDEQTEAEKVAKETDVKVEKESGVENPPEEEKAVEQPNKEKQLESSEKADTVQPVAVEEAEGNEPKAAQEQPKITAKTMMDDHCDSDLDYEDDCLAICASPIDMGLSDPEDTSAPPEKTKPEPTPEPKPDSQSNRTRDPRLEKQQEPDNPPPSLHTPQKKFDMNRLKFTKIVRSVSQNPNIQPSVKMYSLDRQSELDYHEPEVPVVRNAPVVRTFAPPKPPDRGARFHRPVVNDDFEEFNLFGPPIRKVHPEAQQLSHLNLPNRPLEPETEEDLARERDLFFEATGGVMPPVPPNPPDMLMQPPKINGLPLPTLPTALESAEPQKLNEFYKIFDFPCSAYVMEQCLLGQACKNNHLLPDDYRVKSRLFLLSHEMLEQAYSFVELRPILFTKYFRVFCEVFGRRKMRQKLIRIISDVEKPHRDVVYYHYILEGFIFSIMERSNAVAMIIAHHQLRTFKALDILIEMIVECGDSVSSFLPNLKTFAAIPGYQIQNRSIEQLLVIGQRTGHVDLLKFLINELRTAPADKLGCANKDLIMEFLVFVNEKDIVPDFSALMTEVLEKLP